MNVLRTLSVLLVAIFVAGCASDNNKTDFVGDNNKILYTAKKASNRSLLYHLSNNDIRWGGSEVGIKPRLEGKPAKMLMDRGKDSVNKELLRGLDKKDKFAACHVLLTLMNLDDYYPIKGGEWNRLKVKLTGDGKAEYDSSQILILKKYWKDALLIKAAEEARKEFSN